MMKFAVCLFALTLTIPAFAVSWNWINPTPTLSTIWDLETIPESGTEIAVGERGTLFLSDDHWISSRECSYPAGLEDTSFRGVCFTTARTGYVCGSGGVVLKSTDRGESWNQVLSAGQNQLLSCVSFYDSNHGYAVGSTLNGDGFIHRTSDGGEHWDTNTFSNSVASIEVLSATEAVAVGGSGKVYKTTNGGEDWIVVGTPGTFSLNDVDFVSLRRGFAVGMHGYVLITQNGGKDWTEMTVPVGYDTHFYGIEVIDSNNVVAVGFSDNNPVIIYTTNGGITWSLGNSSAPNYLTCVDYNSTSGYTTAGCWGSISSSIDLGVTWNSVSDSFYDHIRELVFADSDNCFCAGLNGFVAKSSDGGDSWDCQQISSSNDLFDIAVWNSSNAIVVGSNGYAAYTVNGGITWNDAVTPVSFNNLNAVTYVEAGKAIAVGDEGIIIVSDDNGASWEFLTGSSVLLSNFQDVCFADNMNGFICGEGNTFLKTTNGGDDWVYLPRHGSAGLSMLAVDCISANTIFCAGIGRSVIKSTDGGVSWEVILSSGMGDWLSIDAASSNDIVVSGQSGTVGYTNDGGVTWNDAHCPTGAYLFSVFYSTYDTTFYIAGHVGAILSLTGTVTPQIGEFTGARTSGQSDMNERISLAVSMNGESVIHIHAQDAVTARIGIADLSGRIVADLGTRNISAGETTVSWNSSNVPAGIYLVFAETDGSISSAKMVLY